MAIGIGAIRQKPHMYDCIVCPVSSCNHE